MDDTDAEDRGWFRVWPFQRVGDGNEGLRPGPEGGCPCGVTPRHRAHRVRETIVAICCVPAACAIGIWVWQPAALPHQAVSLERPAEATRPGRTGSQRPMAPIVAMTYNVHNTVHVRDTMAYISTALQVPRSILGVQELRGRDSSVGARHKAEFVRDNLPVCPSPWLCPAGGFVSPGRAGATSIFFDNEALRVIPEDSISVKLHKKLHIAASADERMCVMDKWLSIAMLEDSATGFRFAFASTHLVRDLQLPDGSMNIGAPEILATYDLEMDIIESRLRAVLDRGYSVVLAIDANWDHDMPVLAGSVPDRLGALGFVSSYSAPGVEDRTPGVRGTHDEDTRAGEGRDLDAIYLANPITPSQPFVLRMTWRANWGPDAPSDHSLVAAGIEAVAPTEPAMDEACAVLPVGSPYCTLPR